jgi:tetratricopeptide (TPR) repeat protein
MDTKTKNGEPDNLTQASFYCFAAGVILLSIVYALPGHLDSAFISYYPKLFILQLASLALTAIWFLRQRKEGIPSVVSSPFLLPIFLLLVLSAISVTYAVNRVETLIHLSHQFSLAVLFLCLVNTLSGKGIKRYFKPVAVSAAIISLIGLIQFPGLGLLWIPSSGMPSATLGYRNFAAMYLILSIPLTTLLYIEARRKSHVWAWGLCAWFQVAFLICTRTRGAWIALALSLLIAGVGSFWLKIRNRLPSGRGLSKSHDLVMAAGAVLVVTFAGLVSPNMGDIGLAGRSPEKVGLTESVSSLFDGESDKNRLALWKHTISMIADHPVSGVGAGNWQFAYPAYDKGDVVWKGATPRRPHNDYLWIAAELGIPGLVLTVWLMWLSLSRCLSLCKAATTRSGYWLPVSLAVSMMALFAHAGVSFPKERIEPSVLLWFTMACVAVLDLERKPRRTVPGKTWVLAQACIVLVLLASSWISLRAVAFDSHHARAIAYSERDDWNRVIRETSLALDEGMFDPQVYMLRGLGYFARGEYLESIRNNLKCLEFHPHLNNALNNLGMAYNGQKEFDKAENVLRKLAKLNPNHVEVHANLGMALQGLERNDEAIVEFRQAVAMDSMTTQLRYLLGAAYERAGESEQATAEYRKILRKHPNDIATRYRLGVVYQDQEKHAMAAAELFRVLQTNRDYIPAYFSLGEVYEAQKDTARAIAAYTAFVKKWKLDPKALTDVKSRMDSLRKK